MENQGKLIKIKSDDWGKANELLGKGYIPVEVRNGEVTFRLQVK